MQVLETLAGGANHEHGDHTIRIETGSHGTEIRVGNRSLHYGPGGVTDSAGAQAPNSQTIESTPQPTLNRWQEEEKIVAAIDAQDRLSKIINHIVNILLPSAAKSEQEAKAKKAEEEATRKRKAEEEEAARKQEEAEAAEEQARLRAQATEEEEEEVADEQDDDGSGDDVDTAPTEGESTSAMRS